MGIFMSFYYVGKASVSKFIFLSTFLLIIICKIYKGVKNGSFVFFMFFFLIVGKTSYKI